MRFGTNHAFQLPPGTDAPTVYAAELERIAYAEELGYDSVWLPEQHFFDYCAAPDVLDLVAYVVGRTSRVRVGAAVANLTLTHPLRFAERASMLDLLSGGRVDLCVGRGYQLPQNVAFEVEEAVTKPMFAEALDVILAAWDGEPHAYRGEHYRFPPVRTYPVPRRPAGDVLLYAVGGTTPMSETIDRGLPLALSQPFGPVARTAEQWREYVALLHASDLPEERVEQLLDRAFVLLYAFVAPTADEARELSKRPYEWHESVLKQLRQPPPPADEWERVYYGPQEPPAVIPDDVWAERTRTALLFTDPDGMSEHIELLRQAGVRTVVPWMGIGGVAQHQVLRSMRLFAEQVAPQFAEQ